jgi:hypothetical protein
MSDRPETLEETQARLARVQQDAAQPPTSAPIPAVSGTPGTPYGPGAPGMPDPAVLGGAGEFGTAPTRPDPYAASTFEPMSAPTMSAPSIAGAPSPVPRRAVSRIAIAAGVLALVTVGGVTAYNAFDGGSPSPYDPDPDQPEYSEEWQTFPGVSYADPNETLAQPSYEQVAATADGVLAEYRDSLTAEFGLVWSQRYEPYTGIESNGYGGDSMLYFYDSGSWQGQATVDDPTARQRIFDLFTELAAANGGEGVLLRNELYSDDEAYSRAEFGAAQLSDQALWSYFDSFASLADGYVSVDVFDRTLPVDDTFDGDYMFTFDESTDTLYVTINGWAGALLKEADREAFETALEPYHGDYEP